MLRYLLDAAGACSISWHLGQAIRSHLKARRQLIHYVLWRASTSLHLQAGSSHQLTVHCKCSKQQHILDLPEPSTALTGAGAAARSSHVTY